MVRVKADTLNIKDLNKENLPWVTELKRTISGLSNTEQSVYLVSSIVPTDGIYNFTSELYSAVESSRVR